jgi:hypothetical protein
MAYNFPIIEISDEGPFFCSGASTLFPTPLFPTGEGPMNYYSKEKL